MSKESGLDQAQLAGGLPLAKPSHRMDRVNANIKKMFGEILQTEADLPADVLVTVTSVETAPNLRSAVIWLSIWPANRGVETMKKIKPQMYDLQGALNRGLSMHPLPRIKLSIDHGAEHAEKIERKLDEID